MAQTGALRIGTRGSRLALWQAEAVREALAAAQGRPREDFAIVTIKTSGDRIQDRPLAEVGGKGLFAKEIEAALLSGAVDLAVHSAKDLETFQPPGLTIAAYLEREDVRDALIARDGAGLEALPRGATIGSASLRREALMRRARPDLRFELLRGNVPTRLRRIEEGAFDATLLAAAGLHRLGLEAAITEYLPVAAFPPSCGQGAVAIQCRSDDAMMIDLLGEIDHRATATAVTCERAFLAALDGSCRTPVAGHARLSGEGLHFDGVLLSPDGQEFYEATLSGAAADAAAIGQAAGEQIRNQAPERFLARVGVRPCD